ncbi:MAG: alpha/beta fold hydrolase [Phycisphaerae bacterium]
MEQDRAESGQIDGDAPAKAEAAKRVLVRWRRVLLFVAWAYALWVVTLYLLQDGLIFASHFTPAAMSGPYMAGTVVIPLEVEDGERVEAWFIPAPGCNEDRPAPVVVFFHGNAELIDFQDDVVRGYHRLGFSVLLPEYRGFGRSGGKPSQDAVRADAVRFLDAVKQRPDVDASWIVFHGRSLGGALAADLATQRKPAALILQSTFTSMTAMARRFLVPGFITRQPFRTDRVLKSLDVPVLIFHGTGDSVIPVSHGRRLAKLARNAGYVEYRCGHNDLPPRDQEDQYWGEIESFLSRRGSQ